MQTFGDMRMNDFIHSRHICFDLQMFSCFHLSEDIYWFISEVCLRICHWAHWTSNERMTIEWWLCLETSAEVTQHDGFYDVFGDLFIRHSGTLITDCWPFSTMVSIVAHFHCPYYIFRAFLFVLPEVRTMIKNPCKNSKIEEDPISEFFRNSKF